MDGTQLVDAVEAGLSSERLGLAVDLLRREVDEGRIPALSTAISSGGQPVLTEAYGCGGWRDDQRAVGESLVVGPDAIFLVASLTKPVVCAGLMLLVQDGLLGLDQLVADLVPEFGTHDKGAVRVRHLMTHTSGLPDQLATNVALRTRHAPLSEFVADVYNLQLAFEPGTQVSYQSMGILMLGEIAERLTGMRLRDLLRDRLFRPLGMADTALGLPAGGHDRIVRCVQSGDPNYGSAPSDWDWNSTYWRDLGAPWGGLHATASDLARFLAHMLGDLPGPLTLAARQAILREHTAAMPRLSWETRRSSRWGLGWTFGSPNFGSLVSPGTFGHTGATGTLFWADPETRLACVLLTNQPSRSAGLFGLYSNVVASAVAG